MASEFTKEMGRELVGCMAFCLRSDGPRRLFGWFGLSDTEKAALLEMLKKLLGDETELDMAGLRKMVETFMDLTDPNDIRDRVTEIETHGQVWLMEKAKSKSYH